MNEYEIMRRCSEEDLAQYANRLDTRAREFVMQAAKLAEPPFHPSLHSQMGELLDRAARLSHLRNNVCLVADMKRRT